MDIAKIKMSLSSGSPIDVPANSIDLDTLIALVQVANASPGFLRITNCSNLAHDAFMALAKAAGDHGRVALQH